LSTVLVGAVLYGLAIPDPPRFMVGPFGLSLPGAWTGFLSMARVVGFFSLGIVAARWIRPPEYLPLVGRNAKRLYLASGLLRLVPILRDDLRRIRLSQAARGHEASRSILRAGGLLPLLAPLFVGTLRRAREQAVALQLAGVHAKEKRA
jgi:hypothetical protein